jgi:hypothetical protein
VGTVNSLRQMESLGTRNAYDEVVGCEKFCDQDAIGMTYERGPHNRSEWAHPASPPSPTVISATATTVISTSSSAPSSSTSTPTAVTTVTSLLLPYLVKTDPSVSLTYGTYVTLAGFAHFLFLLIHKRLWYACWVFLSLQ